LVGLAAFCFARQIGDAGEQLCGDRGVYGLRGKLAQARFQMFSEGLGRKLRAPHADDTERLRQQTCGGEIVEGGEEQAPGEGAGGPENHKAARVRRPSLICSRLRCHGCATFQASAPPTAAASASSAVSILPLRCTRSARRPRAASTSKSPRAWAAFTTPNVAA